MNSPWPLPRDWHWATFGDVARVASDLVDPAAYPDVPHIAPNHIESETGRLLPYRTIRHDGVTSPKHRFRSGQILYSKIRPYLAKVVLAEFEGLCSADMYPVETELEPKFLKWWMLTREFTRLAAGEQARTVLPKINRHALDQLPVPVAPREEQRRIVEILEDHLSRLDAAEAGIVASRRRLASLRERLVIDAVTGAHVPGARVPARLAAEGTRDGELSPLPAGWRWARLGDVADVVGGVTKDANKQSNPNFVEVPYLRVANVQRGALRLDDVTKIRVAPEKAHSLALRQGDVLLNEGGDRDKLARGWVWEGQIEDCIHQNHVFRARVRGELDPYFLSWTANTIGGRWAEQNGKQSVNLASISLSMIRKMPVIVPSAGESQGIVAELNERLGSIDALANELDHASRRAKGLRRALLAAAFAGRLGDRHAAVGVKELASV